VSFVLGPAASSSWPIMFCKRCHKESRSISTAIG
jgi:hypothetical protein